MDMNSDTNLDIDALINQSNIDDNAPEDDLEILIEGDDELATDQKVQESSTIRDLRKQLREQAALLASKPNAKQEEVVLGNKPTLESCEYDPDKFETELQAYHDRAIKIKELDKLKDDENKKLVESKTEQLNAYEKQKKELGAKNYAAAEKEFVESVDQVRGKAILAASDNKALMIYTLGTNQHILDRLLSISDPYRLAAEVGKLEGKIKMQRKSTAAKPEQHVKGTVAQASTKGTEAKLAKLETDALKTGNRTELIMFKKQNNLL